MSKRLSSQRERTLVLGVQLPGHTSWEFKDHMDELSNLVDTAGGEVVESIIQVRRELNPSTILGKGKLFEIKENMGQLKVELVVFYNELSPTQQRNLEDLFDCKVLDRNALVMDIFAKHATTRDGKLQVELAQLRYLLPRLGTRRSWYSRLGGGIGTRGPGETQTDRDRREIRRRITILETEANRLAKRRNLQRQERQSSSIPWAVLVGYTNAGKSSLLNLLAGSEVLVENQLFSTLNTTTRRISLGETGECLLSDTVGFIHELPVQLKAAFSATLEEISGADFLVHVIDSNAPSVPSQIESVEKTLEEVALLDKPMLYVFNKSDLVPEDVSLRWTNRYAPSVSVSAQSGKGVENLRKAFLKILQEIHHPLKVVIPYEKQEILSKIYQMGEIQYKHYLPTGIEIEAFVPQELYSQITKTLKKL